MLQGEDEKEALLSTSIGNSAGILRPNQSARRLGRGLLSTLSFSRKFLGHSGGRLCLWEGGLWGRFSGGCYFGSKRPFDTAISGPFPPTLELHEGAKFSILVIFPKEITK